MLPGALLGHHIHSASDQKANKSDPEVLGPLLDWLISKDNQGEVFRAQAQRIALLSSGCTSSASGSISHALLQQDFRL